MNGIPCDISGLQSLIFAIEQNESTGGHALPTTETQKRKDFNAFEEAQVQAIYDLHQLTGSTSFLEDQYKKTVSIPFCYRINKLLTTLEGFEKRFFSPKPPNNNSKVYKEFLIEGMWEFDLILCWLEEELLLKVSVVREESPKVYCFVKDNVRLIVKGMHTLMEKYDPVHAKLNEFMEEFQIKLKELKSNIEKEIFPILEDDSKKVDYVIDEIHECFEDYQTGSKVFQREVSHLKTDLRTMQEQVIYLGDVKNIPFSSTHQMVFPYLAEDRYFYLDPPLEGAPEPQKDYRILQGFFNDYLSSVMWAHHNHFQGLLGRTIEMRNICNEVFVLLDDLALDLRKFSIEMAKN